MSKALFISNNNRNSSVEMLRILCIIMIIAMHTMGQYFQTTNTLIQEFIVFENSICNSAVSTFVLISGYYGIHFRLKRLLDIINLVWFYSLFSLILFIYMGDFNTLFIIKSIIPIVTNKYWFVTSYIILYTLSPFINNLTNNLDARNFLILLSILYFFFIISPSLTILEILRDSGKGPLNMIIIYLTGRYLRKFDFPILIKGRPYLVLFSCLAIEILLNSSLTLYKHHVFQLFSRDNCIFVVLAAICLLCVFLKHYFSNCYINLIASYTLPIYVIQEAFRPYLPSFSNSISIIFSFIWLTIVIFLLCICIETTRRLVLNKYFIMLNKAECKILCYIYNKSSKFINNYNNRID